MVMLAGRRGGPTPAVTRRGKAKNRAVVSRVPRNTYVPSRAMPKPFTAGSWARDMRSDHWVLCCAGTYISGRPYPRASAMVNRTLSTHGNRDGTPPSMTMVAGEESAPMYITERLGG